MNKLFSGAAFIAAASALRLQKDDLPYTASLVDKLDPVSRYVNDDDLIQLHSQMKKDDLPYPASLVDKLDPVSRYVNDDDLV